MTPRASALKDFISLLLRFIGQTASPAWHSRMGVDTPLIRGALQPPEQWRGCTMLLPGSGGRGGFASRWRQYYHLLWEGTPFLCKGD